MSTATNETPQHLTASTAIDKFARYLGLAPAILLAYGLYFEGQGFLSGTAAVIERHYPVWAKNTEPSRLALNSREFRDIAAYLQMATDCERGAKHCNWTNVLQEAAYASAPMFLRPPGFEDRARALVPKLRAVELAAADKGRLMDNPEAGSLIAERDELLSVVAENIPKTRGVLRNKIVLNHAIALGMILALILARKWVGLAILWPFRLVFRLVFRLLGFVHSKV